MKQKNVFFKAGILLFSLWLLPGIFGCGVISNLMAPPTLTATATETMTPTTPPTLTATMTPTTPPTLTPTFPPIPTDTPMPSPSSSLGVTRQSVQSFFEKEGFSFKSSASDFDGLPAVEGIASTGSRAGTIQIVGPAESITRVSLTVDVLENDPDRVAYLMASLIELTITKNTQKALNWLSEGMLKSIDEGESEFLIDNVQIVVKFNGTAYILTISPSPETSSSSIPDAEVSLILECTPVTVKMQSSQDRYSPNVIALAGQPAGSPVGALQINLPNETGTSKRVLSITFQFTQTFHGKIYPSLLNVGVVEGQWTFSNSKNVYIISGEIAYDISDMTKLFGYYISVSGLGTTQVCQSE